MPRHGRFDLGAPIRRFTICRRRVDLALDSRAAEAVEDDLRRRPTTATAQTPDAGHRDPRKWRGPQPVIKGSRRSREPHRPPAGEGLSAGAFHRIRVSAALRLRAGQCARRRPVTAGRHHRSLEWATGPAGAEHVSRAQRRPSQARTDRDARRGSPRGCGAQAPIRARFGVKLNPAPDRHYAGSKKGLPTVARGPSPTGRRGAGAQTRAIRINAFGFLMAGGGGVRVCPRMRRRRS